MISKEHYDFLLELRKRLLRSFIVMGVIFAVLCFYAQELYTMLASPMLRFLPENVGLLATSVAAPFLTPFKFAFFVALFISVPYLFYQIWAFIAPALYKREKRLLWPLLLSSTFLFYLGTAFAFFVVLPLVFNFFIQIAPVGVEVRPDISLYLDFTLKIFFAFGLAFEVPVATFLLIHSGLVSIKSLQSKRPYVIVGAFVMGMLLTPPDIVSQILLALPICLLFELGLLCGRLNNSENKIDKTGVESI